MFGRPNTRGVGGNRLVVGTNVKNNRDLDIPVSFGRSNRDYIVSKKREKEKRNYERLKSSKLKILTYYILEYRSYKQTRRALSDSLQSLLSSAQRAEPTSMNLVIRLFRFTLGTSPERLEEDFERFNLIIELLNRDFGRVSLELSQSNLLFMLRNGLMLLFLKDHDETLKINRPLIKSIVDKILDLFFSTSNIDNQEVPRYQFKGKNLISMVLDYSMVDLLFLRYLELRAFSGDMEAGVFAEILQEILLLCASKASREDHIFSCYMGRNLVDIPKTNHFLLKGARDLNRKSGIQIDSFFRNRYLWITVCCISILIKSRPILKNDQVKNILMQNLSLLDLESLQDWIMKETPESIRVIRTPLQQIPPNSPFSLLLLHYSLFDHLMVHKNQNTLLTNTTLHEFKSKTQPEQKEITIQTEKELLSLIFFFNCWNFSPFILLGVYKTDPVISNKEEMIDMINIIFEMTCGSIGRVEGGKCRDGSSSLDVEVMRVNLKLLYLARLYMLFLDLEARLSLLGTYIRNMEIIKDDRILFGASERVRENQLLSRVMINKVIQPILNQALDFACRDETTIKHAIQILSLISNIYFPLNQVPNIIIENINYHNNSLIREKVTYLHNALDLCINKTEEETTRHGNALNKRKKSIILFRNFIRFRISSLGEGLKLTENDVDLDDMKIFFLIGELESKSEEVIKSETLMIGVSNKSTRIIQRSRDHEFLEKAYNKLYLRDYYNFQGFYNDLLKSKLKVLREIQAQILTSLSYDTCWVLSLFLCIHNTIIFGNRGSIESFLLDISYSMENLLSLFGICLNHQLLYLDDYEVKTSIGLILSRSSSVMIVSSNSNSNLTEDQKQKQLYPILNTSGILANDELPKGASGSEILRKIMESLSSNFKSLSSLITFKSIQSFNSLQDDSFNIMTSNEESIDQSRGFSMHPILLISNKSQLNYISLFINNLTFSMLKIRLSLRDKSTENEIIGTIHRNKSCSYLSNISIFGELTRRLYQYYLKLNHFQMKLDDPKIKLPWTISEASNLLKPRNVLIQQALHIESLGSFPTNNPGEHEFIQGDEDRDQNWSQTCDDHNSLEDDDDDDESNYLDNGDISYDNNNNIHSSSNLDNNHGKISARLNLLRVFDSTLRYVSNRSKFELLRQILREMPYLIGFEERLHFYYHYIAELRFSHYQPEFFHEIPNFEMRRTNLIEDGLNKVGSLDPNRLRMAFRIIFLDEQGNIEPGIDGGGLLKDFIICISREMCSESFGLFKVCKDNTIVPREYDSLMKISSKFKDLVDGEPLNLKKTNIVLYLFEFLGKIVGKAIYEKILLEIEFNPVFLNSVFGQKNDFDDLLNLDQELFRSLNYLKSLEDHQEMKSLCLTFSITLDLEPIISEDCSLNGGRRYLEVDLIPNGRNIPVNNENKIVYIKLLTHYKLITSIKLQSEAFLRGLSTVIPNESLRLFSPYEIQSLISGVYQSLDVDNLRLNTCYTGYLETSEQVIWLWDILKNEFSIEEQSEFLLFVTSSRKAPLLGFQHLNPKFGIQIVPDNTRLPSASTCFNLLKLPAYSSKEALKSKLRQAIFNSKGFDLS
ncbi:E3A like HECT domain containing ubiquitin [Cryptosporidium canis]|uniref:HECT-type E3 ubiquitin transferase n=1 Tax=Cryptosporidium canis TaxID=195482 RepID=A0A9D5DQH8_9CRYT|nr:E3A like HECT domain containing ubiquitin [Cryptosporidium canis]